MAKVDTKRVYQEIYEPQGVAYGKTLYLTQHYVNQRAMVAKVLAEQQVGATAQVLEIGAGFGSLSDTHPNWRGIEYSATAIAQAKPELLKSGRLQEADARAMPFPDNTFDVVFTFATFEHIPELERVYPEVERVLKPGGILIDGTAWNCRPWTVKLLQYRPYAELGWCDRLEKFLIPLREHVVWRAVMTLPLRVKREIQLALGLPVALEYQALQPDLSLLQRYPFVADQDAFINIDAHATASYLAARGWEVLTCPRLLQRLKLRAEVLVARAPKTR
jgi:SAM-dependent methyltransferase